MNTTEATVFLAPPSPPFAPHLGTIYTWCLLDAAARAHRHLGGQALLPESWNLASRRLDQKLVHVDEDQRPLAYASDVVSAVGAARALVTEYGIVMDTDPLVRDDDPSVQADVMKAVVELAEEGRITRALVAEKWCDHCAIATPATSTIERCFRCERALSIHEKPDWFLKLDFAVILQQAATCAWLPAYAQHRFRDLTDIQPMVRVGHFGRLVGIPSPLDSRQMLDPRLVAALYPRVLRANGFQRIITAAGQDIQRKWLTLVFAASATEPAVDTIINHGVLLADTRRKMSRYDGATIHDLPKASDPVAYRAALLATTLGRDIVASTAPFEDASRLQAKVHNVIRFLRAQRVCTDSDAIDVSQELRATLDVVDVHLDHLDLRGAYAAFRTAVRAELSHRIIPLIRAHGTHDVESIVGRLLSVFAVFYGETTETLGG